MALADCPPLHLTENESGPSQGSPCEPDLISLRQVFNACDANGDGFLTLDELCQWMSQLGLHLTRDGLHDLVRTCDHNLDGRLDFNEFVTLCASTDIPSPTAAAANPETKELEEAFLVFDKDGDGLISPSELRSTLSELGLLAASTSFKRIHSMIRKVDTDGDGEVSFSEFQSMMKGGF